MLNKTAMAMERTCEAVMTSRWLRGDINRTLSVGDDGARYGRKFLARVVAVIVRIGYGGTIQSWTDSESTHDECRDGFMIDISCSGYARLLMGGGDLGSFRSCRLDGSSASVGGIR